MKPVFKFVFAFILILSPFFSLSQNEHKGLWRGADSEDNVGYINIDQDDYAYMVFNGDTLGGRKYAVDGQLAFMKAKVDYQTKKKHNFIDFILFNYDSKEEIARLPGIFTIEEDQMRICLNFKNSKRPKNFNNTNDTITLERVKK